MATLAITTIQSKLHWQNKDANLQMFAEKILSIKEKTEIIVLPEMFSTGFTVHPENLAEPMNGNTVNWMREMAAKKKVILTGSLIIKEPANVSDPGGHQLYFNRLVWMLPNGQCGIYDKRHRFAFAGEDQHYTAGNKRLIASVKGWRVNLLVCYDLRFPVWARQSFPHEKTPTGSEYDVLVFVANWPDKRNTAWKTLLKARAIENQCYVVGVNRVGNDGNDNYYSGDSMVVDPLGEILYHKQDDEDIFTTILSKEYLQTVREKFPFWKDADDFRISNEDED